MKRNVPLLPVGRGTPVSVNVAETATLGAGVSVFVLVFVLPTETAGFVEESSEFVFVFDTEGDDTADDVNGICECDWGVV